MPPYPTHPIQSYASIKRQLISDQVEFVSEWDARFNQKSDNKIQYFYYNN